MSIGSAMEGGERMAKHTTLVAAEMPGLATIIGATPARFPIGGRIRAGTKVLTQAAERYEEARKIYEAGVRAARSFDDIETEITGAIPELRHPLLPKNVSYFTVRRSDFATPELADLILEKFGEERGDGTRRLYRFPVVFPSDAWQTIMPHALMCYGANELKYWSEYSADGRERYCRTFARVPVDGSGKRAIRIFGGRKHVTRAENDGRCDPEVCPEYQSKQCNLTGRFVFLIPGIPSLNTIELATNSFYSMNAARQTLEMVAFLRGGRMSGFLDGRTSFWLTKKLHEVAMIGDDGQPRRVPQWLIELEAPVDLTRLLRTESDETRFAQGERAVAVLNGSQSATKDLVSTANAGSTTLTEVEDAGSAQPQALRKHEAADDAPDGMMSPAAKDDPLAALYALVAELKIPRDKFDRYTRKKYGAGWCRNTNGIKRVAGAIDGFKANGNDAIAAIDAELDMFTSTD
jgi:hypothetical protein